MLSRFDLFLSSTPLAMQIWEKPFELIMGPTDSSTNFSPFPFESHSLVYRKGGGGYPGKRRGGGLALTGKVPPWPWPDESVQFSSLISSAEEERTRMRRATYVSGADGCGHCSFPSSDFAPHRHRHSCNFRAFSHSLSLSLSLSLGGNVA